MEAQQANGNGRVGPPITVGGVINEGWLGEVKAMLPRLKTKWYSRHRLVPGLKLAQDPVIRTLCSTDFGLRREELSQGG